MKTEFDRRGFIKKSVITGITGCTLLAASKFNSFATTYLLSSYQLV